MIIAGSSSFPALLRFFPFPVGRDRTPLIGDADARALSTPRNDRRVCSSHLRLYLSLFSSFFPFLFDSSVSSRCLAIFNVSTEMTVRSVEVTRRPTPKTIQLLPRVALRQGRHPDFTTKGHLYWATPFYFIPLQFHSESTPEQ